MRAANFDNLATGKTIREAVSQSEARVRFGDPKQAINRSSDHLVGAIMQMRGAINQWSTSARERDNAAFGDSGSTLPIRTQIVAATLIGPQIGAIRSGRSARPIATSARKKRSAGPFA
jgi:hypothetical protein